NAARASAGIDRSAAAVPRPAARRIHCLGSIEVLLVFRPMPPCLRLWAMPEERTRKCMRTRAAGAREESVRKAGKRRTAAGGSGPPEFDAASCYNEGTGEPGACATGDITTPVAHAPGSPETLAGVIMTGMLVALFTLTGGAPAEPAATDAAR